MRQNQVFSLPDGMHSAGDHLYLLVRGNGAHRSWIVRIMHNRMQIKRSVGAAKNVTLAQARIRAAELIGMILSGADIARKKPEEAPLRHRFRDIYEEAMRVRCEVARWSEGSVASWESSMRLYILPALGNLYVDEISRDDVLNLLRPLWQDHTQTAVTCRSRVELVLDYCIRRGWRTAENPARWRSNLEFDLPQPKKIHVVRHREAPAIEDLRKAVPELLRTGGGRCVLLCALTASRTNEIAGAEWSEVDWDNAVLSVPPERRKDRKPYPHRVPLSKQALAVLRLQQGQDDEVVFPGRFGRFLSRQALVVALKKAVNGTVTTHGCRSTFSDWCAENGKNEILREKSLMHSVGNATSSAYQRSDLLEQRRELMQEWADALISEADLNELCSKPSTPSTWWSGFGIQGFSKSCRD